MTGWIGVDLDGTLAYYDIWRDAAHIGPPIPVMTERVKRWLAEGRDVRIFTARISHADEAEVARTAIVAWCKNHLGQELPVTNLKDYDMIELWDDRCVAVKCNTGECLNASTRGLV